MNACLLTLALAALAAAPQPLSLDQALRTAAENNPDLAEARAALPVSAAAVEGAAQWPNPVASLSVGPDSPQIIGTLAQRLPVFGQLGTAIDAARAGTSISAATLSLRTLQTLAGVRRAYFALAHAQRSELLAGDRSARTGTLAHMAQERFDAGSASQLDVAQAQLAQQRALQAERDRQAETQIARQELAALLGFAGADDALPEASDPLLPLPTPPPVRTLLQRAAAHPEVAVAEAQAVEARARATREGAALRPTPEVSLTAESFTRDEAQAVTSLRPLLVGNALGLRAGIAFDLPIASQNRGAIRGALREADQAELAATAARKRHATLARTAYIRWEAARRRSELLETTLVPRARQVEAMARVAYAAGRTPLTAVLQSQADVTDVQEEAVAAGAAAQTAFADIEEATGSVL